MQMVTSRLTRTLDTLSTHLILGFFGILFLFPVVFTFMTSFKSQGEVRTNPPTFFPNVWVIDGYTQVFRSNLFKYYIPNSFINSFTSSVLTVAIAALAGYTFSRYKFRGARLLEVLILGLIMIPGLTNLVPLYRMSSDLPHMVDNLSATLSLQPSIHDALAWLVNPSRFIIAVYTAGGLPFSIWIIKSFFDTIPLELEEAAMIDGCGPLQSLRYIVIPLAAPGLLAAFLLAFVDTWNEFLAALVLLTGPTSKTATVGLYDFQSQFEIAYHVWTAACILIMVPVLIMFLLLRRTFFQAMLQGALKG